MEFDCIITTIKTQSLIVQQRQPKLNDAAATNCWNSLSQLPCNEPLLTCYSTDPLHGDGAAAERCRPPTRATACYLARPPSPLLPANLLLPDPRERKSPPGVLCYAATFSSPRAKGPGSQASLEPGPGKRHVRSICYKQTMSGMPRRSCFKILL